ncbi:hypothetical protein AOLI_G00126210 [Acnodon oligacanthus]
MNPALIKKWPEKPEYRHKSSSRCWSCSPGDNLEESDCIGSGTGARVKAESEERAETGTGVGCGVSHHWTINMCPTVTNHYAEFRPWRRDLTFRTRPLTPVRRPVFSLLVVGRWARSYISHHVAALCIDTLGFLSPLNMASSQNGALQVLGSELARLDRQITALLKRQDELLRQKSQLEAAQEVSPSVVAPASSLRTPGDAVLMPAPAPPGPWERQCHRGPSRPSPPLQPVFSSCNRFAALSSPPMPSPIPRALPPDPAPQRSSQDSVYIIGRSIVRHVRVRGIDSPATVSCFPGARVLDIARRLPSALRRRNAFGTGVIHIGTNNISN